MNFENSNVFNLLKVAGLLLHLETEYGNELSINQSINQSLIWIRQKTDWTDRVVWENN